MKVLTFSTVFPNSAQTTHGLFVFERARHLSERVDMRVIAPVSWHVRLRAAVPDRERIGTLDVRHPTFWYSPGVFKALDGLFLFFSTLRAVVLVRREFAFDLIDAHFTFPEGFAAILLGRWFNCPVTITLRGTLIPLSVYQVRRRIMAWTLRRATRLIAVAHPLAEHAVRLGADPSRITVIPNGVNGDTFAPLDRAVARARLGLSPDRPLVVSVGHLSPRKGFQRVLAALPDLLRDLPDLSFAIVGGAGAERSNAEDLRRTVRDAQLEQHVIFTGSQPPATVALWLNAADIFVLATDYEGCPNAVLEAMACGRPVVVSKVGEVERMVPAFAGLLVDDPDDIATLGASIRTAFQHRWDTVAIREYALQHTWDRVADRVMAEWERVLGGRNEFHTTHRENVTTTAGDLNEGQNETTAC